jgi:hypothetical protein
MPGLGCESPMYAAQSTGMTGASQHTQPLLVEMWSPELFAMAGLEP